jgi:hypothetical protein
MERGRRSMGADNYRSIRTAVIRGRHNHEAARICRRSEGRTIYEESHLSRTRRPHLKNTVWYHPRINMIGVLDEKFNFTSYYEAREQQYGYCVVRDDEFLMFLGWVKVGAL